MALNRRFLLRRRPQGEPQGDDFQLVAAPVPDVDDVEFLFCNPHVSLDPAMRGWIDDKVSYRPPVPNSEVVRAVMRLSQLSFESRWKLKRAAHQTHRYPSRDTAAGTQPRHLTLDRLLEVEMPPTWRAQRRMPGLSAA